MSLFVQVINDEIKQVWDTQPPAGEAGWRSAVEVKPDIIAHRQGYSHHTFDLTTDPVQIVYQPYDISVEERKWGMKGNAAHEFQQVIQEQAKDPATYDPAVIAAAKDASVAKQAAIEAATTHDELDALM